jgi:hypothetical protein
MESSKPQNIRSMLLIALLIINAIVVRNAFTGSEKWYWLLLVTIPTLLFFQKVTKRNM